VGAISPEGHGTFYAWGETKGKEEYDWITYIHCDGSMETCHDIGSDIAGSENDVAHVLWGSFWVMPTQDQILELTNKCTCTWTRRNDVNGNLFKGPNGCSIFLPESDFWRRGHDGSDVTDGNNDDLKRETDELPSAGYYWSSTLNPSDSNSSSYLLFSYGNVYPDGYNYRCTGLTIRPVISEPSVILQLESSADDILQCIYNIYGMKITDNIADMKNLPPGIYVVSGKKMFVR